MDYRWLSIKDTKHALGADHRTICGARRGLTDNYMFPIKTDRACPDCVRLVDRAVHQHD